MAASFRYRVFAPQVTGGEERLGSMRGQQQLAVVAGILKVLPINQNRRAQTRGSGDNINDKLPSAAWVAAILAAPPGE